jgi:hypothetical protein
MHLHTFDFSDVLIVALPYQSYDGIHFCINYGVCKKLYKYSTASVLT